MVEEVAGGNPRINRCSFCSTLPDAAEPTVTFKPPGEACADNTVPESVAANIPAPPSSRTVAEPADGHTGATAFAFGNSATPGALPPTADTGVDDSVESGSAATAADGGKPTNKPTVNDSTKPETGANKRETRSRRPTDPPQIANAAHQARQ